MAPPGRGPDGFLAGLRPNSRMLARCPQSARRSACVADVRNQRLNRAIVDGKLGHGFQKMKNPPRDVLGGGFDGLGRQVRVGAFLRSCRCPDDSGNITPDRGVLLHDQTASKRTNEARRGQTRQALPYLAQFLEAQLSARIFAALTQPGRDIPHVVQNAPDVDVVGAVDVEHDVRIALQRPAAQAR